MANYYTYGMVPDVDETVYGTSVNYAGLGFPELADRGLPEEEPVGPSPLSLVEDEGMLPQAPPETVEKYASYLPKETPAATPPPPLATPNPIPPGLEAAFLRMRGQSPEQLAAKAEATAQTKPQREVLSELLQTGQFDKAFKYAKDEGVQNLLIDPTELKTLRGPFSNDEMKSFFAAMPKDLMGEQDERAVKFTPEQALEQSLRVSQIPREGIAAGPLGEIIGYPDVQRAFEPQELVKEMNAFDKLIRAAVIGGVAYAGGTALAGLGGAGGAGAGAAGTGGTGGGLSGAIKAVGSIPAKVGGAIAETLGLPVTSTVGKAALGNAVITGGTTAAKGGDLEDVLKAGLLSAGLTYVSAPVIDKLKDAAQAVGSKLGIATAAPASATGAAVSDALSDVATDELLREVTVTATRPALSSLIGTAVGALPTSTKVDLPEPKISAEPTPTEPTDELAEVVVTSQRPDLTTLGGLATPTTTTPEPVVADRPVIEEPIEQPLEEIVVTSERPPLSDLLGLGTVSVPTTTPVEVTQPEYIEDVVLPEEEPLEEVVVTSQRPPLSDLLGLGTVSVPTTTPVDVTQPDYIEDIVLPEEEPLEEVVVTGQRPPLSDLLGLGAVTVPTTTPVDVTQPDYIEEVVLPEEEPLEEVVVTGTRPPLADLLGLGAVAVPTTTPVDLPQPEVILDQIVYPEEVVVEGTKPTDGGLNLPPFTIPLQTPVEGIKEPDISKPDPLKELMDKYGSLENLLKLIGAIGSAASGTKKPTTPTAPGTGGMGGALPKYTYTRQQLSPDIDYYTYGTRPEAKFFDYGLQLEKPTQPAGPQPEGPPAKKPGDEPVMAQGGLMGYSKGGSNETRYFDGPGSGRDDKIPALLSDGEYVMDAETLALLGDGSTKEGARRMDKFRANIRKHKGRALSRGQISPDAKSPDKYMGGGLS